MTSIQESAIVDTSELAELCDFDEDEGPKEDLTATVETDPTAKSEFHVQMRSWTVRDMEALVIEAAARQLVGKNASEGHLAKAVQDAAIREITTRADAKLATVADDILDQPMLVGAYDSKTPTTMRERIGLYAKDYLTSPVGADDKWDDSYYGRQNNKPRILRIVEKALDAKFKAEIEKATSAAIVEIQAAIREQHKALLTAETARIREAIAKVTT